MIITEKDSANLREALAYLAKSRTSVSHAIEFNAEVEEEQIETQARIEAASTAAPRYLHDCNDSESSDSKTFAAELEEATVAAVFDVPLHQQRAEPRPKVLSIF